MRDHGPPDEDRSVASPGEDADSVAPQEEDTPAVGPALRAGVALFNEGHRLAAHEPWEAAWLPLSAGDDERLLHGLIQFAAATHHARTGNESGAVGTAEGAVGYLDGLGDARHGLALDPIRRWCRAIASDPSVVDRESPPTLRIDGAEIGFEDLDLEGMIAAAPALAEATGIGSESTMETAGELVRAERGTGRTRVTELLVAYLREPATRPQVAARIADHVDRERRKRDDVDGLF